MGTGHRQKKPKRKPLKLAPCEAAKLFRLWQEAIADSRAPQG